MNSRQILKSQIIIDDMNKEAERLKEYIIMEQQKLEEVKQQLEIERQQFQNDQNDEKALFEETSKQLREKRNEKKKLIKEIEWLNNKIAQEETQIKKCDDALIEGRQHKHFLDVLAILAEKKPYNPKKKPNQATNQQNEEIKDQTKDSDGTFLTGVANVNVSRSTWQKIPKSPAKVSTTLPNQQKQDPKQQEKAKKPEGEPVEINLDDEYEDDDFSKPYFEDVESLMNFINSIEDDNLFKIGLLEQEEQQKERMIRDMDVKIQKVRESITEVERNIEGFNKTKQQLLTKLNYYQNRGWNNPKANDRKVVGKRADKQRSVDASFLDKKEQEKKDDRNSYFILKNADPDCKDSKLDIFFKKVIDILAKLNIQGQDPENDLVSALSKIEADLYIKVEIKDYLFWKDETNHKTTMRDLYKEIHVQRIDKQVAERKKQDMIHNLEMKEKMLERANKQADK